MNNPNNLFNMMQTGGLTSTAGGTALSRAFQRKRDIERLEEIQREEAERQKKGGLFGSVASFAGGLLGGAIGGPAGAAIGAGLGKGLGERVGAGKARDYDASGTVFRQQSFRDVDEASEEFNEGILGRSLLEGAKTGLTAGLTPGGGIYGQYNPIGSAGRENIGKAIMGKGVTGYGGTQSLFSFADPQYANVSVGPISGPVTFDASQYSDLFPSFQESIGSNLTGGMGLFEDGGLIGMQTGGLTAEQILREQGLTADDKQLALFQAFDPTGIQSATQATGESLLGMTGGQGLASAGSGFGSQQRAVSQAVGQAQQALEGEIEAEQKAFESQTLGTAADIVAGGGEFGTYVEGGSGGNNYNIGLSVGDPFPEGAFTPSGYSGDVPEINFIHTDNAGINYRWTGTTWVASF
jgi:hypothetical protein